MPSTDPVEIKPLAAADTHAPSIAVATHPAHDSPTALSPADLEQILSAFGDATTRLSRTHEALRSEVASLKAELAEARGQVERTRHMALLGEMAAGIAHEIRNPLGSIRLYAKMLADDLAAQPALQSTASKIGHAVVRLDGVVGDVLSFSRHLQLRPEPVDVYDLVEASFDFARSDAPAWSSLTFDLSGVARNTTVRADPHLIQQALINLIRNSVEIMAEHKSPAPLIAISAGRREIRQSDGSLANMLVIAIEDRGPGIKADVLARLFEPFFTTRASGTGLGLAIVHRIIDAHGGRISASNIEPPAHGARFEIMLPDESHAHAVHPAS